MIALALALALIAQEPAASAPPADAPQATAEQVAPTAAEAAGPTGAPKDD